MGWTGSLKIDNLTTKKWLEKEFTSESDDHKWELTDVSMRGSVAYGIYKSQDKKTGIVLAEGFIILTRKEGDWIYFKEMGESVHPYYYDAPKRLLDKLDALYKRGVRYMTLTWNNSPSWATSALDETTQSNLPHKGLTEFGKQVVRRMNELGMLVDLSHTGERTFWDAMAITTRPVIASHSCVYNLCPHRRNLKDDQIKAIGRNGGVIHLNFYAGFIDSSYERRSSAFLSQHQAEIDSMAATGMQPDYARFAVAEKYPGNVNGMRPSIELLLDHLDYIVRLIGVDHVGLGSDFDGIEAPPQELNGVEDFPLITAVIVGIERRRQADSLPPRYFPAGRRTSRGSG